MNSCPRRLIWTTSIMLFVDTTPLYHRHEASACSTDGSSVVVEPRAVRAHSGSIASALPVQPRVGWFPAACPRPSTPDPDGNGDENKSVARWSLRSVRPCGFVLNRRDTEDAGDGLTPYSGRQVNIPEKAISRSGFLRLSRIAASRLSAPLQHALASQPS